jgi:GntR family transcriptional regulator
VRVVHSERDRSRLTREFGVPLYQQIQHLIRHRIAKGEYTPGAQIPSENELCRELNVSRVTLRDALRELVRDHMLVKVQGKGTFVSVDPPKLLAPVKYAGFLDELQERVLKLKIAAVDMQPIPATAELIITLRLSDNAEVMRIRRLRHVDDEPFSFTINYLPLEIGTRIRERDLHSVPLLRILQDDLKIPIVHAHETIEAAPADPEVAQKLGIPVLYPVMHMKRVMFTTGDRPFELVETYYRADKYHYSVNLVRVKRNGRWTWRTEVETSA